MAAKRLIRPTFTGATRGYGAALLPDGGVTPYPAWVSGATRGYGAAILPDGGVALSGLHFAAGCFCRPDKRKRHQAHRLLGGQQISNGAHT